MTKQVQAFVANDGTIFLSKAECDAYEARAIRSSKLVELADTLAITDDVTAQALGTTIPLLLSHADKFIAALTVKPETRRSHKAKTKSTLSVAPAAQLEVTNEATGSPAVVA